MTGLAEQGVYQDLPNAFGQLLRCLLTLEDDAARHQSIDEFGAYLHDYADEAFAVGAEAGARQLLQRIDATFLTPDKPADPTQSQAVSTEEIQRWESVNAELATVRAAWETAQADLAAAREQVQRLQLEPAPNARRPQRFAVVERTFAANRLDGAAARRTALAAEHTALTQALQGERNQLARQDGARRLAAIEMELNRS
jgi:hypothetical protein